MIIPVYHVVSSMVPISATITTNTNDFESGMAVGLNSDGQAVRAYGSDIACIGLAGDRNRASEAYEWVNRVSDSGNDTRASGMMTIYHSGGEFFVDVDDSALQTPAGSTISGVISTGATTTPGTVLYTENSSGATAGKLTHTSTSTVTVAVCVTAAAALDGGIPGEYEPLTSNLASDDTPRTWVKIKLTV